MKRVDSLMDSNSRGDFGGLAPGVYACLALIISKIPLDERPPYASGDASKSASQVIAEIAGEAGYVVSIASSPKPHIVLAFHSARQAVEAITSYYLTTKGGSDAEQVSAGIAIGEIENLTDPALDLTVQKALALAGFASDGQVLISASMFEILRDTAPVECGFDDLGTIHLEFQLRRERVVQLLHPLIPSIRAFIKTEERVRPSLPHRFGLLIGRGSIVDDVYGRLLRFPLVTIVGAGGIGKSHLASKVAFELQQDGEDIVWVNLAGVCQAEHFYQALGDALGLRAKYAMPLDKLILRQLASRKIHIILDGCDQCLGPVSRFIEQANSSTGPIFLVTASKRLRLDKESVLQLGPLDTPQVDLPWSPEELEDQDSTSLFMDRARESCPDFEVDEGEALAVARICNHFGGHPLSILLAAKRVKNRTPSQILFELGKVECGVSEDRNESSPRRHRNLVQAIRWSNRSLTQDAQRLLVSLFPMLGKWQKEDAAALADLATENIAHPIEELLDAGLIELEIGQGFGDYYRMPAHVSSLVERYLVSGEQREAAREQHCLVMIGKLASAARKLGGADEVEALDFFDGFRGDLTAAFEHTLRPGGHVKTFVEGIIISWSYWYKRNRIEQGLKLIDRALKRSAELIPLDVARLLNFAGALAIKSGQSERAASYLHRACKITEKVNHPHLMGAILQNDGNRMWSDGDSKGAIGYFERAAKFLEPGSSPEFLASLYSSWLSALIDDGSIEEADQMLEKVRLGFRDSKDHHEIWLDLMSVGRLAYRRGDFKVAYEFCAKAAETAQDMSDEASLARSLYWVAESEFSLGNIRSSALLLGAARSAGQRSGIQLYRVNELRFASLEGKCKKVLGERQFSEFLIAGALESLSELLVIEAVN